MTLMFNRKLIASCSVVSLQHIEMGKTTTTTMTTIKRLKGYRNKLRLVWILY